MMKCFSSILLVTLFVGALAQAAATDDLVCVNKLKAKKLKNRAVSKRVIQFGDRASKLKNKNKKIVRMIAEKTQLLQDIEDGNAEFCEPTKKEQEKIDGFQNSIDDFLKKADIACDKVIDGLKEVETNQKILDALNDDIAEAKKANDDAAA